MTFSIIIFHPHLQLGLSTRSLRTLNASSFSQGSLKPHTSLGHNPKVADEQFFTSVGVYRGSLVAVRRVKRSGVILRRDDLIELKAVSLKLHAAIQEINHTIYGIFI